MLVIYLVVIVQRFGGEGRWSWLLQRVSKMWRGPKKSLVPFWRLPLRLDFEKSLAGISIGGCRGSTGDSTGGGRKWFLEV